MNATTTERRPCYMRPDPCGEDDHVTASGIVIHHRGPRMYVVEDGHARDEWKCFSSLADAVLWAEGRR